METLKTKALDFTKRIFVALPIIFLLWMVGGYSVNTLFWDDFEPIWDYISMRTSGKIDWGVIAAFQNEHRMVIPRVIMLLVGAVTHWNTKVIVYISALLLCVAYCVIVRQTAGKKIADFKYYDVLYVLIIGFCLFSCCQYENVLWSFQLAWILIEFCAVMGLAAFSLYVKTGAKKYMYSVLLFGVIASFSSLHGLIIWPCYVILAIIYQIAEHKFDKKFWFYLVPVMLVTIAVYFIGYHHVYEHDMARATSVFQVIIFMIANIGSVLSFFNLGIPMLFFGVVEIILSLTLFVMLLKNKQIKENIFPLGLMIFGAGFAAVLAVGRGGWGVMVSRYMTFPLLIVIGNLVILRYFLMKQKTGKMALFACFLFLANNALSTSALYFYEVDHWYFDKSFRSVILKNYQLATDEQLLVLLYPHFTSREDAMEHIERVEKANLSVFYEEKEK